MSRLRRTLRLSQQLDDRLVATAKERGFRNSSAFLRAAIEEQLGRRNEDDQTAKLIASLDRLFEEIRRVTRTQQAQFAFLDSLTKVLLTCIPEPIADAVEPAVSKGRLRYDRLIKAAGKAMSGDATGVMNDLLGVEMKGPRDGAH
jgi:Arc/MetJ-type ribon-helix-helix transcriptional regulator